MRMLLAALALLTLPAWADDLTVATLLPPPDIAPAAEAPASGMVSVPVLKQPVQKGETITADNLTTQDIPAAQAYASTITDAATLVGQQAVRPLPAATPLNRLHLRVAPAITRNQAVTMVYRRGGIELSGSGQALEDGQIGQTIRIVNPATRATLMGTVAQGGTVEVN